MSKEKNQQTGGSLFLTLLTIVFITLKLAEIGIVATWSWWWILSPIWIPLAIVLIIVIGLIVYDRS